MKLVFIHGAPATGKATVARALLARLGGRLIENHNAIDVVRTHCDFGAPGFWERVHRHRLDALAAAARDGAPLAAMTFCYSAPDDEPMVVAFEELAQRRGGVLLPVFLHCSDTAIAARIGNDDRRARGKVSTMVGLERFRQIYRDAPVPRTNCLKLDTAQAPPEVTAEAIIRHFGLDVA